jgi:ADP-ribosylglycohydrolase
MLGAIAGDIIGSVYEGSPIKTTDFPLFQEGCRFTDDTVLTLAVAHAILEDKEYGQTLKDFGRKYPRAGYGGHFYQWIFEERVRPYNSWGNGSAMRVSPVGIAFEAQESVLREAEKTAQVSHNHPEGIKGAQAVALAVYLAKKGEAKQSIREEISGRFGYDLDRTVKGIRPTYSFDISCQGSVPEALVAFLDSEDYEDAVRMAVSLGGDSDTLACIAGGIAQAYYGEISDSIVRNTRERLTPYLRQVLDRFEGVYL